MRRRRGAGASIAANPVLIGAATTLVIDRRGLPRLQREQRPAVRPDLPAQGRGAQRGEPRARATRCASAARASASSTRSTAQYAARTARSIAVLDLEARDDRRAAAEGLHACIDPAALRARPQVRRDHPGAARSRATQTATRSRCAAPSRSRSRSTRSSTCSTRSTRVGAAEEPARVRQRVRRPRAGRSTPAIGDLVPLLTVLDAGAPQPRRTRDTQLSQLLPGARARRRAIVAPVAEVQASAVRQPRHDVHRARQRRPPVHPGDDRAAAPPALDEAHPRSSRSSGRSSTNSAAFFRELQPGVTALRAARPTCRPRLDDRHAGAVALAEAQQAPRRRVPRALQRLRPRPTRDRSASRR